jgi:hypothetical protein
MSRLRASVMTKVVSGAVITMVGGFSIAFSLLLYNLVGTISTAQTFFGSAAVLMYMSVEGVFLCVVIAAAYWTLHRK